MTFNTLKALGFVTVFTFSPFLMACDAPADSDDTALPAYEASSPEEVGSVTSSDPQSPEGDAPAAEVLPDEIPESDIPPPPNREVFSDESCDFEEWVGQPLNETVIKELNRPSRVLKPGDPVTMDHNPMRVNVEHEDGKVTRVWCG